MAVYLPHHDYKLEDLHAAAVEIARVVTEAKRPLFASRELDAAVMLETAYAESRFIAGAIGDHGAALCAYQLHFAPRSVLYDLHDCTARAYAHLRWSIASCRAWPLAPYVGGCDRPLARRMSAQRLYVARHIVAETHKRHTTRSTTKLVRYILGDNASRTNPLHAARSAPNQRGLASDVVRARASGAPPVEPHRRRRVESDCDEGQRAVGLPTHVELTLRCAWVITADGNACGKPATHRVTFSDDDRALVCQSCALEVTQFAAEHKTKVKVEKLT